MKKNFCVYAVLSVLVVFSSFNVAFAAPPSSATSVKLPPPPPDNFSEAPHIEYNCSMTVSPTATGNPIVLQRTGTGLFTNDGIGGTTYSFSENMYFDPTRIGSLGVTLEKIGDYYYLYLAIVIGRDNTIAKMYTAVVGSSSQSSTDLRLHPDYKIVIGANNSDGLPEVGGTCTLRFF